MMTDETKAPADFKHWPTLKTATAEMKTEDKMKLFKQLLPLLLVVTCSGLALNALFGGSAAFEQEVEDFEEDEEAEAEAEAKAETEEEDEDEEISLLEEVLGKELETDKEEFDKEDEDEVDEEDEEEFYEEDKEENDEEDEEEFDEEDEEEEEEHTSALEEEGDDYEDFRTF